MTERLVITNAGTEVELLPERGAAIAGYRTRDGNAVHHWFAAMPDEVACFPMVPFCSRIADASFDFGGRHIHLVPNNLPETHAIHGHGFQCAWEVDELADARAVLSFTHAADAWPWRYSAAMSVEIEGMDLCIAITLTNHGQSSMPYGMGLHPYLPLTDTTVVSADVDGVWALDEELIGRGRATVDASDDPGSGLRPAGRNLDAAYAGWRGTAEVVWPEGRASLVMTASTADTLVLYSPRDAEFICVEPLSNCPNGFNLPDVAPGNFRVLAAGASVTESWRFKPRLLDQ